jgi:hypothetical protein
MAGFTLPCTFKGSTGMTEDFIITVNHNGTQHPFTARLLQQGYTHKFEVEVFGQPVYFEPDDSGSYRAIKMPWQEEKDLLAIDKTLLGEIALQIEAILA